MQIGVGSYSYNPLVNSGRMTQIEVIAKAKAMGFDTIEFSTLILPAGEEKAGFAEKLKKECDRVGFEIANYTIGADFIKGSDGNLDAEIARVKGEVDIARILQARGMRHDATSGFPPNKVGARSFETALPRIVRGCRAVTEYADQFGIRTMVENHGLFCQDSARVEQLVCGVDHRNFGVLIDMGNFICVDENPGKAIGVLMPYAFHVHAKDFHLKPGTAVDPGAGWSPTRAGNYKRGAVIGHGDIPIVQCLRVMKKAGYDGVLSIEFEGIEETVKALEIGLTNLRRYVRDVYDA